MKWRILALDPGTRYAGLTVLDIVGDRFTIPYCETLDLHKLKLLHPDIVHYQGEFFARCRALYSAVYRTACDYGVNAFIYETQFVGRTKNVSSYEVSVRCIEHALMAMFNYRDDIVITEVSPGAVKQALGVPGNDGDKDSMRNALMNLHGDKINVSMLTEHAIDSVAVGIAGAIKLTGSPIC